MNIRRVYEYALQREREGLAFFRSKASAAGHASLTGVFKRLEREEETHIVFIQSLLDALEDSETDSSPESALPSSSSDEGFFSSRAISEMLDQTTAEAMVPDLPALRMAWLIERDLVEFYRAASSRTEGKSKRAFEMLASWEEGHERLFKALHDKAFTEYTGMPWGG